MLIVRYLKFKFKFKLYKNSLGGKNIRKFGFRFAAIK